MSASTHPLHVPSGLRTAIARVARRMRDPLPTDLRWLLALPPLLAIVPLTVFAASLLLLLADVRDDEARRELQQATDALARAIDQEVAGSVRRLETLAALAALGDEARADYVRLAVREVDRNGDWLDLVLSTADGRVLHRVRDAAASVPAAPAPLRLHQDQALRSGRPAVSDVFRKRSTGEPKVAVSVPVGGAEPARGLLSARLDPQRLAARLAADPIVRRDATVVLVDREGRVVAHSRAQAEAFGRAAPSVPAPHARAALGFGWSVVVHAPRSGAAVGGATGPLLALALLGVLLLAAGVALSAAIGRRVAAIVARAGDAARDVAAARRPQLGPAPIRQFDGLFDALDEAGARVTEALERERRARVAAEAADRGKDRFLLMLGHELRNPLNAVAHAGHVLRRRDLSAPQRAGMLDVLQRQSRRLGQLVDDLLEFGRLLTGSFALERREVAVDRLLRGSIAVFSAHGALSSHVLHAELEPLRAEVDPARLEQAFANLLSNAIRHTPAGGTIDVRLWAEGGDLRLSVSDTGAGIEPERLARLFEPFVPGPPPAGGAPGGLGIGLALCRLLVEAHGGRIEARSDGPMRGATFVVSIPLGAAGGPGDAASRDRVCSPDEPQRTASTWTNRSRSRPRPRPGRA